MANCRKELNMTKKDQCNKKILIYYEINLNIGLILLYLSPLKSILHCNIKFDCLCLGILKIICIIPNSILYTWHLIMNNHFCYHSNSIILTHIQLLNKSFF